MGKGRSANDFDKRRFFFEASPEDLDLCLEGRPDKRFKPYSADVQEWCKDHAPIVGLDSSPQDGASQTPQLLKIVITDGSSAEEALGLLLGAPRDQVQRLLTQTFVNSSGKGKPAILQVPFSEDGDSARLGAEGVYFDVDLGELWSNVSDHGLRAQVMNPNH